MTSIKTPAAPVIKVLHLIETTGPGGAETTFVRLLRHLDSERYQHLVILRGEGWLADEVRKVGINPIFMGSKGSFNMRYAFNLMRFIIREKIQLIHAHLLGANVYGALAAILCHVPMISTFHGSVDVAAGERLLSTKFRIVNTGSKVIVCVSRRLHEEMNARSPLNFRKLRLIHNGVDEKDYVGLAEKTLRKELCISETARIVVSVGNIRPAKGYQYLVEAAALLKKSRIEYHFVVVGQPEKNLYKALQLQVQELDVENIVHFLGFRQNVNKLLPQADIFLLPSLSEGFSISTVEAMMAGVPVIATRSGGPEEILEENSTGILIPPADPKAIVVAIKQLEDRQATERMKIEAGREARKRFSLNSMVSAYAGLYNELTLKLVKVECTDSQF